MLLVGIRACFAGRMTHPERAGVGPQAMALPSLVKWGWRLVPHHRALKPWGLRSCDGPPAVFALPRQAHQAGSSLQRDSNIRYGATERGLGTFLLPDFASRAIAW